MQTNQEQQGFAFHSHLLIIEKEINKKIGA
jgi:hypothetical protein